MPKLLLKAGRIKVKKIPDFKTEQDLAKEVVAWLKEQAFEVYQEVKIYSSRCDIVAVRAGIHCAIETKLQFNNSVVMQAFRNKNCAEYSYIAVPRYRYGDEKHLLEMFMRQHGIGLIKVEKYAYREGCKIDYEIKPNLNRHARKSPSLYIKNFLNEAQKEQACAGTNRGGYWTPFSHTCSHILKEVQINNGIGLKELAKKIDHHYNTDGSFVSCMRKLIEQGVVKGVEGRLEKGKLKIYLKEQPCP